MADVFDPYRKWLGIPAAEQPPHHYRLLGIGLFEDDSDTISIAADRQMAHVRTFQIGPHSALSQKLLNELAAARLTLLDAKKRAAYDELLRAKLAAAEAAKGGAGEGGPTGPQIVTPAPVPQAVPGPQPTPHAPVPVAAGQGRGGDPGGMEPAHDPANFPPSSAPRLRRKRSRREPAVWLGLAAAALVLAGVVYFVQSQSAIEPDRRTVVAHNAPAGPDEPAAHKTTPTPDASPPPEARQDDSQPKAAEMESDSGSASADPPTEPAVDDQPLDTGRPEEPEVIPADTPDAVRELAEPPQTERPRSLGDLARSVDRPQLKRADRESPPEGKALLAAVGHFTQQYGKQITAAKTPQARLKILQRLWNEARDGSQSTELRYVMLDHVGKETLLQGNVGLAYRTAAEVARQFDVDPLAIRLKALEAAAKTAQTHDACAIGILQALSVADRAAAEGKLDVANKAAGQAGIFARKTKDKELVAQVDRRKVTLREQSSHGGTYKKALADLKRTPDDPVANRTAGKYEVLVLGNWTEGLPRLASSGDPRLAEIAQLEAAARVDLSQWAPLAAAWWQASQAESDEFLKPLCQSQARYCYLQASRAGRAGDLPPETAQQLKGLAGYPMSRLIPGVAARYYNEGDFQHQRVERADSAIDFNYGQGSPDPAVQTNFFSCRWTGFIKPPLAGRYRIVTFTDDGVRLWVDGKEILNRWGQRVGWEQAELELSDEPHSFRLEYNDTFDVAVAMFGWTLAAFPDNQHNQWSPVDALYYDPQSPFDLPELP